MAACFAPHVRPTRLPLAFAARLLYIVPCFSAIHVSRNRSTQRLKRDEFQFFEVFDRPKKKLEADRGDFKYVQKKISVCKIKSE